MADSKITALTALTAADPATDMFPVVDVSDTTMAASGTTKRISINNILACSPSATLASATITGDLTVRTNKLLVTSSGVGFGVNPSYPVDVLASGVIAQFLRDLTVDTGIQIQADNGGAIIQTVGNHALSIYTSNVERYNIGSTGISTWSVAGSTAMTLNSTGLGIGASPSATLDIRKNAAGSRFLSYHTGGNGTLTAATDLNEMRSDDTTTAYNLLNVNLVGSSRFLVKSTGTVVIGATAGDLLVGTASTGVGKVYIRRDSLTAPVIQVGNEAATGKMITFRTAGDTEVGSISFTNVAVAYNTSSDYRLKESVKSISGGLARVNALKPSVYKWKANGSAGEGFLAHELAEVVPLAVTGDKDAVDADGEPAYQGVDLSKLVPILVAAIQELTAEVNALKNA